eukprot:symbB.v1.2.003969.t1/scaffold170.1/size288889/15
MIVHMEPKTTPSARMPNNKAQITSLYARFSTKCWFSCKIEPPRFTSIFSLAAIWSTTEARPEGAVAMTVAMAFDSINAPGFGTLAIWNLKRQNLNTLRSMEDRRRPP